MIFEEYHGAETSLAAARIEYVGWLSPEPGERCEFALDLREPDCGATPAVALGWRLTDGSGTRIALCAEHEHGLAEGWESLIRYLAARSN